MEFTQVLGNTRAMYTTWNPSRVMEIISDIPSPFVRTSCFVTPQFAVALLWLVNYIALMVNYVRTRINAGITRLQP